MKLETFSKRATKGRLAGAVPSVYLDTTCLHTCKIPSTSVGGAITPSRTTISLNSKGKTLLL